MRSRFVLGLLTLSMACATDRVQPDAGTPIDSGGTDTGVGVDTGSVDTGVIGTGACEGKPCLDEIADGVAFGTLSAATGARTRCGLEDHVRFLLPLQAGALDAVVFYDSDRFPTNYEFVEAAFPELLPTTLKTYLEQFESETLERRFASGRIFQRRGGGFAFEIETRALFSEPMNEARVDALRQILQTRFFETLAYAPQSNADRQAATGFPGALFDVLLPEACPEEMCSDPNARCVSVPADAALCGRFIDGRAVDVAFDNQIRISLVPGNHEVPVDPSGAPFQLVNGGEFGPDRVSIEVNEMGTATGMSSGGATWVRYEQPVVMGADTLVLDWSIYEGFANPLVMREPMLDQVVMGGVLNGSQNFDDFVQASGCEASGIDLFIAEARFPGGDFVRLFYRHQVPFAGSGPVLPVRAVGKIGGTDFEVTDYFQLVYAGQHHNWDNQFWILFDAPIDVSGMSAHGIWIDESDFNREPPDGIYLLDQDHTVLAPLTVDMYERTPEY